jgi:hypothetical protein
MEGSLPSLQELKPSPYSEPDQSNPHSNAVRSILILAFATIYTWIFQMVSIS